MQVRTLEKEKEDLSAQLHSVICSRDTSLEQMHFELKVMPIC